MSSMVAQSSIQRKAKKFDGAGFVAPMVSAGACSKMTPSICRHALSHIEPRLDKSLWPIIWSRASFEARLKDLDDTDRTRGRTLPPISTPSLHGKGVA
jgi:hypothetical protein